MQAKTEEQSTAPVKLWVVGSIGIDDVKTRLRSRKNLLGGSLPYSTAAASFYVKTGAVGVVGSDFPAGFERRWRAFGTDLSGIRHLQGHTFRWSGCYDENMIDRQTISTELGVFASFKPVLPEAYAAAPFVLLGNIQPELQLHLLRQVRGTPFVALDTMNLWIEQARPALRRVIKAVDLLTINDSEARLLSGRWNLLECAERLKKLGPRYIVIKKGEHGALLFTPGGHYLIPPYPVRSVVDPTGAGDTYAGAFMGVLAQSGTVDDATLREALLQASALASFGVEAFSLEKLESLTGAQLRQRVADLRRMSGAVE